jgi:hypothetical protein
MGPIFWKLPDQWLADAQQGAPSRIGLSERCALYPPLLMAASRDVRLISAAPEPSDNASLVLMADGALSDADLDLIEAFAGRVAVQPVGGLRPVDLERLARLGAPLVVARDDGLLVSRYPVPLDVVVLPARGAGARRAEDGAAVRALAVLGQSPALNEPSQRGSIVVVGDAAGVAAMAPALIRARERRGANIELYLRDPDRLDLASLGLAGVKLARDVALTLTDIEQARAMGCAFADEAPGSDRPAIWVRTALVAGAPFIATAHPSLDGLAAAGVVGDWDRGLDRALAQESRLSAAVLAAAATQVERQAAGRFALSWSAALDRAFASARPRTSVAPPQPQVLAFFDLAQDLDVLAPVVEALQARGALDVRVAVSDWLRTESPRTFARLAQAGFKVETINREAAVRGEAPGLGGVAGVLVAADANVEAHLASRGLVDRALAAGLRTFSLQHGFENIGLTWRGKQDDQVDFGADRLFIWGPVAALPGWIAPQTRAAVRPLGDPKAPALAGAGLAWPDGPWTRRVAVFENLHWERYDDAWRARVLADISAVAAASPDTLFLLKPHHAGRWLTRHPLAAPRGRNIRLIDPRDPQWEPFTALSLMAGADKVVTTPSTVAVDAVRAGRPVALFGYGLDLAAYAPLPVLQSAEDFRRFLARPDDQLLQGNEAFLARTFLPGPAAHRIAGAIETRLAEPRADATPRRPMSSLKESVN